MLCLSLSSRSHIAPRHNHVVVFSFQVDEPVHYWQKRRDWREKKRSFVLSSLSEQAGRVQYKGALFINHSDKLLLFQTQKKNQYCGNVALCPFTLPPFYPSFLSQFGEFCSHSHQLYCRPPSSTHTCALTDARTHTHTHTMAKACITLTTNKLDPSFECSPCPSYYGSTPALHRSSRCDEQAKHISRSLNCLIGDEFCYLLINILCPSFLLIRHLNIWHSSFDGDQYDALPAIQAGKLNANFAFEMR